MTPEQIASQYLFGESDFVPCRPEKAYYDPLYGPRISWNELVRQYRECNNEVPNRLYGVTINHEGDAV